MILVGPQEIPVTGQSEAFKLVKEELNKKGVKYKMVCFSSKQNSSAFSPLIKCLEYLSIYCRFSISCLLVRNKVAYLNLSATKAGVLRDTGFILLAKLFRLRIVAHCHFGNLKEFYDGQGKLYRLMLDKSIPKIDRIIILSNRLKPMLQPFPSVLSKASVVLNGLPFEVGHGQPAYKQLPDEGTEPVKLIYLSNLIESKGYLDTVEAVRILVNEQSLNVQLDLYGKFMLSSDDTLFKKVEQAEVHLNSFIKQNKLEGHIVYHGELKSSDKEVALHKAHFLVLPTNYFLEGQPISIIEALATCTPVIATDFRAIGDMVIDNETGFFVDYQQPAQIASKVAAVIKNPELYSSISKKAHSHYLKNFTKEKYSSAVVDLLMALPNE